MKGNTREPVRLDLLIAELRKIVRYENDRGEEYNAVHVNRAADELEARMGGMHIDAKHWGEVGRLRARVRELEATLEGQATECQQHREKAWAERDVLAAVIEQADAKLRDTRLQIHTRNDEAATILASADTDAALREHDERTYALVAGQFSSEVEYDGAEVIGRIRSIQHTLEPHDEGKCIVCENDPEGI